MAINISAWSIRHPLPPLVMAAAIVALGFISFNKLPITRMPNVDVPVISVTVTQFGAAPAELEVAGHEDSRGRRLRASPAPTTSTPSSPTGYPARRSRSGWRRTPIARSMTSRTR